MIAELSHPAGQDQRRCDSFDHFAFKELMFVGEMDRQPRLYQGIHEIVNPVFNDFLQAVACRKYGYKAGSISREVDSCVYTVSEPNFDYLEFYHERRKELSDKQVAWTFQMRLLSERYEVAQTLKLMQAGFSPPKMITAFDYWVIADRSLECQLSFLDQFGYSDGSPAGDQQMQDCKALLTEVHLHHPFLIASVLSKGGVALHFDKKPTRTTIKPYFDAMISFMRQYGRLEISPNAMRESLYGGSVVI